MGRPIKILAALKEYSMEREPAQTILCLMSGFSSQGNRARSGWRRGTDYQCPQLSRSLVDEEF